MSKTTAPRIKLVTVAVTVTRKLVPNCSEVLVTKTDKQPQPKPIKKELKKIDENNYEGTAGDVVGKAIGYSYGPAFKFEYVLLVPVKGKEMKITFDDWIFKQDDRVAINRATMTKFGFKVAELTVVFVKDQQFIFFIPFSTILK